MQIKDQRVTNIKQKYGPKFEPITFTVEEAPGTGSIYGRLSTEAEQRRLAFERVNASAARSTRSRRCHHVGQPRTCKIPGVSGLPAARASTPLFMPQSPEDGSMC
jgi:hypothetical protein